ncbi:GAF domain-containing protein [Stutzerimonas degradans]
MRYLYFFFGLLARIFVIAIPLVVFSQYRQTLSEPVDTWPLDIILHIALSILVLLGCDYLKDFSKSYQARKKFNPLQRACRESSATIKCLLETGEFRPKQASYVIESSLRQIENLVEIALGKNKTEGSEISANCMIYQTQRGSDPILTLCHWGTKFAGREALSLSVKADLPGAPQAILSNEVTYIDDTQSKVHQKLFLGKNYRSIVSIPLKNEGKPIGVINIDSTDTKFYKSQKSFEANILTLLAGQIDTIKSLIKTSNKTEKASKNIQPAGFIKEQGRNANGEYIRFHDGSQICTGRLEINPKAPGELHVSYPAAFISAPSLDIHGTDLAPTANNPNGFVVENCLGASETNPLSYRAFGRFLQQAI